MFEYVHFGSAHDLIGLQELTSTVEVDPVVVGRKVADGAEDDPEVRLNA